MVTHAPTPPIAGFAFPFRIDPATGGVAASGGGDKLRDNVAHIIMTAIGERTMRRSYGAGLRQLVQDPNNGVLWSIIQHQIGKSVAQFEPRVLLQQLTLAPGDDGGSVLVHIRYVVRNTQAAHSFSIPVAFSSV